MVIAILYALGVSAGGILALLVALVLFKRYRVIRHPAVFKARVRTTEAPAFPGLKDSWQNCRAAWVTTVLTTRKGLQLAVADVLPLERLDAVRDAAASDGVKGLGEAPVIASFTTTTGGKIEVAFSEADRSRGLLPWSSSATVAASQM